MAKRVPGSRTVAIDTVPLPERELGMTVQKGQLAKVRGKFVLKVGRRSTEIAPGPLMPAASLEKLVGEDILAAYTPKGHLVAIGTWPTPERPRLRPRWIICYYPVPELLREVDGDLRLGLIDSMLRSRFITPALARIARESIGARR